MYCFTSSTGAPFSSSRTANEFRNVRPPIRSTSIPARSSVALTCRYTVALCSMPPSFSVAGKSSTTPVHSPQSNGMAESFVKTIKRDYAKLALRPDAKTVLQQLADWFEHYNTKHPHSALKYLPPRMFRERQALNN